MAQNSASPSGNRNALIQWLALVVVAVLALLAAFVFFGGDTAAVTRACCPGASCISLIQHRSLVRSAHSCYELANIVIEAGRGAGL